MGVTDGGVREVECRGGGERNIDSIITVPADVTVTDHFPPLYLRARRGRERERRGRGEGEERTRERERERESAGKWRERKEGRGEDTHRIN